MVFKKSCREVSKLSVEALNPKFDPNLSNLLSDNGKISWLGKPNLKTPTRFLFKKSCREDSRAREEPANPNFDPNLCSKYPSSDSVVAWIKRSLDSDIDDEDFLLLVDFLLHGKQNSAEGEERLSSDPGILENS